MNEKRGTKPTKPMKPTDKHCPVCHKAEVAKDRRLCANCGARLFWPGDQPEHILETTEVSEQSTQAAEAGWFMFLTPGPRGTGWYRRDAVKFFSEQSLV
jgi:hypothetical protein